MLVRELQLRQNKSTINSQTLTNSFFPFSILGKLS